MAIFIRGRSRCAICGRVVADGEEVLTAPAFSQNELDPLYKISDSVVHIGCLDKVGGSELVLGLVSVWNERTSPSCRRCLACGSVITNPDDYVFLGYLGDDESWLGKYNFTHLHRSCLPSWSGRADFIRACEAAVSAGEWKGDYLKSLLKACDG